MSGKYHWFALRRELDYECILGLNHGKQLLTLYFSSSPHQLNLVLSCVVFFYYYYYYFLAIKAWAARRKLGACILLVFMLIADFRS